MTAFRPFLHPDDLHGFRRATARHLHGDTPAFGPPPHARPTPGLGVDPDARPRRGSA